MFDRIKIWARRGTDASAHQPEGQRSAEALYRQSLEQRDQGDVAGALVSLEAFARQYPEHPEGHRELTLLLVGQKRFAEANRAIARGVHAAPTSPDLLALAGNLHLHHGRLAEAVTLFDRAVEAAPEFPEAHYNRGLALQGLARTGEALDSLERAVALRPDYGAAWRARGDILLAKADLSGALEAYEAALRIDPTSTPLIGAKANALRAMGRTGAALDAYDAALSGGAADAPDPDILNNRALVLGELGRHPDALVDLDRAIVARPAFVEAINNRGLALQAMQRFEEALASYESALELAPQLAQAHANRGNVLQELARHEDAIAAFERALELDPHLPGTWLNKALSQLLLGRLPEGWSAYEHRWPGRVEGRPIRDFPVPTWTGREPLAGRVILLHAEQGLGDTIQFCRYAAKVRELGARVILEVQAPLVGPMRRLEGVDQVLARGDELPFFDYHCALMSLPLAFGTALDTIPTADAYLRVDEERSGLATWTAESERSALSRIGLVWSGNPDHRKDAERSIPLAVLQPLLSLKADFISLQKDVRPSDEAALAAMPGLSDVRDRLTDFEDTAALIVTLDLVIAVDTSTAHLAAALGKPVWLLLPFNPDWRWLLDRADSPWYPTMRLFRQNRRGDWDGVVQRLVENLESALASGQRSV